MECQQVQYGGQPMNQQRKIILKIMHCNNVGFLNLSAILTINFTNQYLLIFVLQSKWHLLLILIKQIYNYSNNNIIYEKKIILSHCVLHVVHSETVRTFYLVNFFLLKYITYCLIVYSCVAKGSYFSVHHKISIFK